MGYKRKLYPTLKKLYYYTTVTAATPIKVVFSQKSILHRQYNHFTETLALIKPVFVMFTATCLLCKTPIVHVYFQGCTGNSIYLGF